MPPTLNTGRRTTIRERREAVVSTKHPRALFVQTRAAGRLLLLRSFAVGSFHRKPRLLPRFPTARNIPKLLESFRF